MDLVWREANEDGGEWRFDKCKPLRGRPKTMRHHYNCAVRPDCTAKKLLIFDDNGNITSTAYKGVHNHPRTDNADYTEIVPSVTEVGPHNIDIFKAETRFDEKLYIQIETVSEEIDDGFNWKEYARKPTKKSTYPKRYYRCAQLRCSARKKMRRDPNLLTLVYIGKHDHEPAAE